MPHARTSHAEVCAEPRRWLASTRLLDLGDAKLQLRARALTQLAKNEREKALALYSFVKRLPFARPFKLRVRSPRHVLEAGAGAVLTAVFARKPWPQPRHIEPDFVAWEAPGEFVTRTCEHGSCSESFVQTLPHVRVDDWVFGVSSVSIGGFESPVASAVPGGAFKPYVKPAEEKK